MPAMGLRGKGSSQEILDFDGLCLSQPHLTIGFSADYVHLRNIVLLNATA